MALFTPPLPSGSRLSPRSSTTPWSHGAGGSSGYPQTPGQSHDTERRYGGTLSAMSLFVCEACGAVENTALGHYWGRHLYPPTPLDEQVITHMALCSECAFGTWHGKFPKVQWDGKREVINPPPNPRSEAIKTEKVRWH